MKNGIGELKMTAGSGFRVRKSIRFLSCCALPIVFVLFSDSVKGEPPVQMEEPVIGEELQPVPLSADLTAGATELIVPLFPIRIVHPGEGARLPAVSSSFVYGSADPNGQLTVNGQPVAVHPGGGFLTMVSYKPGDFVIQAELKIGTMTSTLTRKITVAAPSPVPPVKPLTIELVRPEIDMEVISGDRVPVLCRGSPGMQAYFQVQGVKGKFPMLEGSELGVYRGVFISLARDELQNAEIRVTLVDDKRDEKESKVAGGKLTSLWSRPPVVVEVSTGNAILRAAPAVSAGDKAGYIGFPALGTRLLVFGRRGSELKIRLSASKFGWISESEVRPLPEGTAPPSATIGSLSIESRERSTVIQIPMGQKLPLEIVSSPDRQTVDVSFYGAVSNTDWIHYPSTAGAVSFVQWFQDDAETYRIRVYARPDSWWGYDARYEGSTFVLELRQPPPLRTPEFPLEGLTVVVDPGHSSDRGAVGPTGMLEKDANLLIAKCLKKKLLEEKAMVVMTREADDHVYLYDRPRLAWQAKGDILLSVHNNALAEGKNPFEKNGYSVYYFQPQSFDLAKEIHGAYGELLGQPTNLRRGIRDDGLHYGNLALARSSQMPSVLVESAYMILPDEEAFLRTEKFQCECAESMLRGLKRYVRRFRK